MVSVGDSIRIAGTSVRSRLLETSIGVSAIDNLIGGLVPLPSIVIIDEINSRRYAPIIAKCFLSEGVSYRHDLFVASLKNSCEEILSSLPPKLDGQSRTDNDSKTKEPASGTDDLKIAWRYAAVGSVQSTLDRGRPPSLYDFTKSIKRENLESCHISCYPSTSQPSYSFADLWNSLSKELLSEEHSVDKSAKPKNSVNLLRAVIYDSSLPLWTDPEHLFKFMSHLRASICDSYSVVMLLINSSTISECIREKLYSFADIAFRLEAIDDSSEDALVMDVGKYVGYFRIVRLPSVNSVATFCPDSVDLVFEIHKNRFDIKRLHLPPAFDIKDESSGNFPSCQGFIDSF
ncbi:hypothetical protein AB6A40_000356 [Gnathostoma spinigerum]|uniref:Elongator complex protein 4 n=1 Tax=Gnathostoma spinigerum TaxID=75299 RepID=A0ABD6E408_9BILA